MTNDLNFLNTYVAVVDENVSAIIKQNFLFQTQLKIAETRLAQMDDAIRRADELTSQNKELQRRITELITLTSSYKTLDEDKSRLQVSLNETSQTKNQLQEELNSSKQELARLRKQVEEIDTLRKENAGFKKKLGIKEDKPVKEKPADKPADDLKTVAGTF